MPSAEPTPIPARLRALLVCPGCRGELLDHAAGLVCVECARLYPVLGGVVSFAPEESRPWPPRR
ncbi:Trm112 family protein [Myxococcota bacterium]|nr:Trm112 family protein [Myxococcota bacterium]